MTEEELRNLHFELDYEHKEERWWEQEPLRILDLSCNSLTAIDDRIEFLEEVNTLDVRIMISTLHFIININRCHL